ncbi:MAG: diguanylate cyclase [Desulfobacteraceae bacterium]|nr:diguanylate cyclase [Desulfobacteraceae bacterium]
MEYSILIVDDDVSITESVEEYLQILNYNVITAPNAEQALKILNKFKADVILTDIMMNEMDGLELTKQIKEKDPTTAVMVMTGYSAEYSYENAIQAGANDFIFKPFRFEELDLRIKRVLKESKMLRERNRMLKEMEQLAITDALTKLYNSRYFFSQIKAEIERFERYERPLSLLILDIDFFKDYNDKWGHLEGDKVLMNIGIIIHECIRKMDTAYRYGGEEFAILLPETDLKKACLVGNRIRKTIGKTRFRPKKDADVSITISAGATTFIKEEDFHVFIKRCDMALYKSKEAGRNKLTAFNSD